MDYTSGILIVNGQIRGVPPYSTLDPFILSNHQIYHPGTNFLGNKNIKFWFKDYRSTPGGLNWADFSGKWYYLKKEKIVQLATPGTSNHGWGVAVDVHNTTINQIISNVNAMKWLRDNILSYGWSREKGVSPVDDRYHLVYYREDVFDSFTPLPRIEPPSAIVKPKPKPRTQVTPKVNPTKPRNKTAPTFIPRGFNQNTRQ